MPQKRFMLLRIVCLIFGLVGASAAGHAEAARQCYSRDETRERIRIDRLAEPFAVVRTTAGAIHAEALGARLCRTDGALVYEINLLDANGRVVHATVDAATGRLVAQHR